MESTGLQEESCPFLKSSIFFSFQKKKNKNDRKHYCRQICCMNPISVAELGEGVCKVRKKVLHPNFPYPLILRSPHDS